MTLARVLRPTCEARSAARKASPSTYTPPWKYRTIWRGSIPSTVISAVGTPPSAAAVTVTSAGSGCADINSRSCRRCSLTSLPAGKADCRRIASRFSRCSVLMDDLPSVEIRKAAPQADSPPPTRCRASGLPMLPTPIAAAALAGGARPGRRASASTRSGSALGRGRSDRRREVGLHADLGEHGAGHDVAVEPFDLPVAEVPEVGAPYVELRSRWPDDAGRGFQRPEEGALNRQLDGDRVAKHIDTVQLTMDIGEELGDAVYNLAKLLAPIALLADSAMFYASVPQVDHAVLGEAADKPGD